MPAAQYAEVVVNIEKALSDTYHYHIPADLRPQLAIGHLVEVEFGRRLAQGIVVAFADSAPVEETKPIIGLIDPDPVLWPWQIELARWLSRRYLAPLNACFRLLLPPGLTRWADVTYDVAPRWDGSGQLTAAQSQVVELLRARGDLRGRQINRALKDVDWQPAATQLVRRGILRRASVLDPPRARPKQVRTAELIAPPARIRAAAAELGRASKAADVLHHLAELADPLPAEAAVREATGARRAHLEALAAEGLIACFPAQAVVVPVPGRKAPDEYAAALAHLPAAPDALPDPSLLPALAAAGLVRVEAQPATVSLTIPDRRVHGHILRLRKAETYGAVLDLLAREGRALAVGDIYAQTSATHKHLERLAELDLIRLSAAEVWRDSLADRDFTPADPPGLTLDQARVWGRVKVAMIEGEEEAGERGSGGAGERSLTSDHSPLTLDDDDSDATNPLDATTPFLLHGVTGSGKTEIYMRAIDFALERGQRAIVLVPEIALTPQTVRRFAARFPGRVAVLHSSLSDGERYDTWRRARRGLFDIAIGPRSALFAPLPNLGVIVVDEEHDSSYKQTPPVPPPYYHARDAAIALARLTGATVILGSATPDVVTYHRARAGRYQLLELPKRIMGHRQRIQGQADRLHVESRYRPLAEGGGGEDILTHDDALTIPLPPIQVVDMRQELRAGNRSVFSRALDAAITETLARGEQSILFLNRRGTSTFVNCRDCGHVMSCPRCGIPLTYHQPNMMLVCHQCGRREAYPQVCPTCGSERIRFFGLGTERLEALVRERWPGARLIRWDRDTTADTGSHEALLAGFINREADILVGTQMIAKGLDLPFVTLVGVISADIALGLPDYNTGERVFQVLAQVAGRAGRGLLGGRVLIQTYQPEHYAVRAAADHDYAGFYVEEIRFRTQRALPPFRRMARLLISDPVNDRAKRLAEDMAQVLALAVRERSLAATEILGPMPAYFTRLDGRYRWHLIIYSPDPHRLLDDLHIPQPWVIDIDPEST
uniref:replication restart helicase PriA n=1 Tax=Promineifilum sp. TaxID=2664178 RepID=UPI0035AEAB9A